MSARAKPRSGSRYFDQNGGEDRSLRKSVARRSMKEASEDELEGGVRMDSDEGEGEGEGRGKRGPASPAREASASPEKIRRKGPASPVKMRRRRSPRKSISRRGAKEESEGDEAGMDSDDLDEFSEEEEEEGARKRKRRVRSSRARKSPAKNASPRKKRRTKTQAGSDYEDEDALELAEGQEVVGVVVQAPKTGRVPPGQVSRNTLDFLRELARPECNDRGWFKLHEPVYRAAEKEWKDFVEAFTDLLVEADPQIPPLPPKDVIHRIYRDVRFSNDKTPYKTGFSASFSRSGRKGIFAHYHIAVKPNGESLIAAGAWCPGKNELQTIRNNIMRNPARLRAVISAPEFVGYFGEPRPHPKGARRSLWGFEDELKTAPKGVDKNHKDIDLLKLRTFAVIHRFPDEVVLEPGFREELARVVRVARPFVHCLNDMMTIPPDDDDDDNGSGGEEEGEEGDGEE